MYLKGGYNIVFSYDRFNRGSQFVLTKASTVLKGLINNASKTGINEHLSWLVTPLRLSFTPIQPFQIIINYLAKLIRHRFEHEIRRRNFLH